MSAGSMSAVNLLGTVDLATAALRSGLQLGTLQRGPAARRRLGLVDATDLVEDDQREVRLTEESVRAFEQRAADRAASRRVRVQGSGLLVAAQISRLEAKLAALRQKSVSQ
jgi:hypothetical protein